MAEAGCTSEENPNEECKLSENPSCQVAEALIECEVSSLQHDGESIAEKDDVADVIFCDASTLKNQRTPCSNQSKPGHGPEELQWPIFRTIAESVKKQKEVLSDFEEKVEAEGAYGTTESETDSFEWLFDHEIFTELPVSDSNLQRPLDVAINYDHERNDVVRQYLLLMDEDPLLDFQLIEGLLLDEVNESPPAYPLGELKTTECQICYSFTTLYLRPCCAFPVCNSCLEAYFHARVSEASVKIPCPNPDCCQTVHRDEILARLNVEMKLKFNQFLVNANKEPHRKTCPRCSTIMTIDLKLLQEPVAKKFGLQVECSECFLSWCFPCQAPWHESMKCKDYRRGDKLVKVWARERPQGQVNAQRCPKCKVFIQRSAGCDHMTCTMCKTHFCYQCGEKFREFKFIGNHYSRLSIFGCKYLYKHDKPMQRKLVRGSIFGAKLLAAPVLGGLALGAGAVVAGLGLVVLPFYGGYKLHKKLQRIKEMKRLQESAKRYPWGDLRTASCLATSDEVFNEFVGRERIPVTLHTEEYVKNETARTEGRIPTPFYPEEYVKNEVGRTHRKLPNPFYTEEYAKNETGKSERTLSQSSNQDSFTSVTCVINLENPSSSSSSAAAANVSISGQSVDCIDSNTVDSVQHEPTNCCPKKLNMETLESFLAADEEKIGKVYKLGRFSAANTGISTVPDPVYSKESNTSGSSISVEVEKVDAAAAAAALKVPSGKVVPVLVIANNTEIFV